jgi:ADP-ribose pyrophosphatase YjhB (NUDIX family)
MGSKPWLDWAQRLHTIAQAGLTYAQDPFDRERYTELRRIAAEVLAAHSNLPLERVEDFLRLEQGYATPKVDVRAVVEQDGRLLFVREVTDGRWALPGGWADFGDSPSQVAERETREETGFKVRAKKLLALYDRSKHDHPDDFWACYKVFMHCELLGGSAQTSHESLEVRFYGQDDLPPLSLSRNTQRQVLRMFEHLSDPTLPTDFD